MDLVEREKVRQRLLSRKQIKLPRKLGDRRKKGIILENIRDEIASYPTARHAMEAFLFAVLSPEDCSRGFDWLARLHSGHRGTGLDNSICPCCGGLIEPASGPAAPAVAVLLLPTKTRHARTAAAAGTVCYACVAYRLDFEWDRIAHAFVSTVFGPEIASLIELAAPAICVDKPLQEVRARQRASISGGRA